VAEGDTLARIAHVLSEVLVGRDVLAARGRAGGPRLERVVGRTVESVRAQGKHLLIAFGGGLTLHTHLAMHGSWHRYRPGERWRRSAARAVAVIETDDSLAVCFDAPTVELLDTRALAIHPWISRLGPDALADDFDVADAVSRLRAAGAGVTIGEALLDQRLVAGLGNVYRSELCFLERISPFAPVSTLSDEQLTALLGRGARLLRANRGGGRRVTTGSGTPGALYVYGRTGRPCRRCAMPIASRVAGSPPRRAYWCPRCQA
jgi:endonuclease VIII